MSLHPNQIWVDGQNVSKAAVRAWANGVETDLAGLAAIINTLPSEGSGGSSGDDAVIWVNVFRFGAVGDGIVDDGPAFNLAGQAAAAIGGRVIIPGGFKYLISTQVTCPQGVIWEGMGDTSEIYQDANEAFRADDVVGVGFRFLQFSCAHSTFGPRMVNSEFFVTDCFFNGALNDGVVASTGIGFEASACPRGLFARNRWYQQNDAIYLSATNRDSGDPCGTIIVMDDQFWIDDLGTYWSYPAQVYDYFVDHLVCINLRGKNILPGNLGNAGPIGYLIYEGDGLGLSVSIYECVLENTLANQYLTALALTSSCQYTTVSDCRAMAYEATSGIYLFKGTATKRITIQDSEGLNCGIFAPESGTLDEALVRNVSLVFTGASSMNIGIRFGANSAQVKRCLSHGNSVIGAAQSGIFFNAGNDWFESIDDTVIDANISNTAYVDGVNPYEVSGIVAYGPARGRIKGARVENAIGGTGKMRFGIAAGSPTHAIEMDDDNQIFGIVTAPTLNGFTVANPPGTYPYYAKGKRLANTAPASGGPAGWVCVDSLVTTLTNSEAGAATVIEVASVGTAASGDKVMIELTNGSIHATTINGAPGGGAITLTTGLPSGAAAGKRLFTNRWKAEANLA